MTDLGNKLKIIRLRHSILSKYVAQILGIQYRNYQRYENGELDLQMRKIKVLCDLFGISADWLLDINEEIYSHKLIAKREYELMPTFMELPLPTVLKHIYFNKREEFYSLEDRAKLICLIQCVDFDKDKYLPLIQKILTQ